MRLSTLVLTLLILSSTAGAQSASPPPTGRSLTGLPALNFDADEGLGYGAILQFYDYGTGVAPYRFSLQPTLFFTTKGRRDVVLFLDAPHLLPGDWRFGGSLARMQQLSTPYYGIGNATVTDSMLTKSPNPYYYRYGRTVLQANGDFQHQLGHRSVRMLAGIGSHNVVIDPVPYDSGTTLVAKQFGRAELPSRNTNYARLGLVLDTRDQEIGTHRGTWSELLVQRAGRVAGGDEVFTRVTGSVRQFVPLGADVTFAQRVVVQTVRGDPSFNELFVVQSSYRDDEALGGASSIRGIPRNRYAGKGIAFSNSELRWSAARFGLAGHDTRLVLSTFADAGRVWASGLDLSTIASDLHFGYGGGVHLAIGPSFVVTTDVGHSSQSTAAIYIGLGYLF
ncbi:MAG: BamA/TamA family outer membrane protein [Gemmatimonadota bacterium]